MKSIFIFFLIILSLYLHAQDTFSIVAVDVETGEIGSAGASCIDEVIFPGSGGVYTITDVHPGLGAINTQSYYHETNQQNAGFRLNLGASAQEIIDWLVENDVFDSPEQRQYGVIRFGENGEADAAAFTGDDCFDWKGHIVGENYAIQGNILLDETILQGMETAFLQTEGTLAEKLMAALQGANVPGADIRCLDEGVSSLSAYIQMAKPTDHKDSLTLDINVESTPFGVEPIDSLQTLFDEWFAQNPPDTINTFNQNIKPNFIKIYPNPTSKNLNISIKNTQPFQLLIFDIQGKKIIEKTIKNTEIIDVENWEKGLYWLEILQGEEVIYTEKVVVD